MGENERSPEKKPDHPQAELGLPYRLELAAVGQR